MSAPFSHFHHNIDAGRVRFNMQAGCGLDTLDSLADLAASTQRAYEAAREMCRVSDDTPFNHRWDGQEWKPRK